MVGQTFINLPVKDLQRTVDFFTALGFTFNPQFTNEQGTCMIINEHTFAMLLTESFFGGFTNKRVADAKSATEVLIALSVESRDAVDDMVQKALGAGGKAPMPTQDHGWMYQHGFEDPDGHMWEVFYSDISKLNQ
jgi:uncharacterized protein